MNTQLLSPR